MKSEKIPYFNDVMYKERMKNGLCICLCPRNHDRRVFGALSVKCGSIDSAIKRNDKTFHFPSGTAHFLEHMLMEGIMDEFSANGALANGHTTFDRTTYTFSCNGKVKENIESLFSLLNVDKMSEAGVATQKDIIRQELSAKSSDPAWTGIFSLLQSLYHHHPVQHPIGGYEERIGNITVELLRNYYSHYYRPTNMIFILVGDFDVQEVYQVLQRLHGKGGDNPTNQAVGLIAGEPCDIRHPDRAAYMSLNKPYLYMGWKESDNYRLPHTQNLMEHALLKALALDYLFGKSSFLYENLIENGRVEKGITWDYYKGHTYGFSYVEVVTEEPEKIKQYAREFLSKTLKSDIDEELFESLRKKAIGRYLTSFDSIMTLSINIIEWEHKGCNYFHSIHALNSFSLQDFQSALKAFLEADATTSFTLLPREEVGIGAAI